MTRYNQNILTTEHLADLVVGGSQGSGGVQKPDNYEFLRYVEWTQNDLMWCVPNSAPHTQAILVEGDQIGGVGGHMVENPWVWIIQMFCQMSLTKDLSDGVIPEDIDPNGTEFNERYNGYAAGVIEKNGFAQRIFVDYSSNATFHRWTHGLLIQDHPTSDGMGLERHPCRWD